MARPSMPTGTKTIDGHGYIRVKMPDHPLAVAGWVREHTLVLYTKIGPGTHPCDGCGQPVTWGTNLEPDHLDRNRANNTPANLVAVCRACNNRRRGACLTDDHLDKVAKLYRSAVERGDPPRQTVVEQMQVTRSTAARWVSTARRRGLLGPALQGRGGEAGDVRKNRG